MTNLPLDQVLHGDCLDLLPSLPEKSVDLIFADPPYNLQLKRSLRRPDQSLVAAVEDGWDKFEDFKQYDIFTRQWLDACRRLLKDTGSLWVIGTYHNIYRVGSVLQDLGYWILNDIIWLKSNPMPNFRGVRFTNAHETLIWAQKKRGSKYVFNHHAMKSLNDDLQMRSDWYLPLCTGRERLRDNGSRIHSTQKPEALLYRVLLASTSPGDVVLDPFFGSGTTGAVARKLGRHFIGIEKDEKYVTAARERIKEVTPLPPDTLSLDEPRRKRRIPFGALLEAGLLQAGQILYFFMDPAREAVILADGHLQCGQFSGSIHSVARQLLDNSPANGWDCWLAQVNGSMTSINSLRKWMETNTKNEIDKSPS